MSGTGVTVESGKARVLVSDESVSRILDTAVALAHWFGDWSERNPLLFVIFLLVLLAAFIVWQKERTSQKTQKIEYRNRRERARIQLPLNLGGKRDTDPDGGLR